MVAVSIKFPGYGSESFSPCHDPPTFPVVSMPLPGQIPAVSFSNENLPDRFVSMTGYVVKIRSFLDWIIIHRIISFPQTVM